MYAQKVKYGKSLLSYGGEAGAFEKSAEASDEKKEKKTKKKCFLKQNMGHYIVVF